MKSCIHVQPGGFMCQTCWEHERDLRREAMAFGIQRHPDYYKIWPDDLKGDFKFIPPKKKRKKTIKIKKSLYERLKSTLP